jgi:hypothetical protein
MADLYALELLKSGRQVDMSTVEREFAKLDTSTRNAWLMASRLNNVLMGTNFSSSSGSSNHHRADSSFQESTREHHGNSGRGRSSKPKKSQKNKKKGPSGYQLFSKPVRDKLMAQYAKDHPEEGKPKITQFSAAVAAEWAALPQSQKDVWNQNAIAERAKRLAEEGKATAVEEVVEETPEPVEVPKKKKKVTIQEERDKSPKPSSKHKKETRKEETKSSSKSKSSTSKNQAPPPSKSSSKVQIKAPESSEASSFEEEEGEQADQVASFDESSE